MHRLYNFPCRKSPPQIAHRFDLSRKFSGTESITCKGVPTTKWLYKSFDICNVAQRFRVRFISLAFHPIDVSDKFKIIYLSSFIYQESVKKESLGSRSRWGCKGKEKGVRVASSVQTIYRRKRHVWEGLEMKARGKRGWGGLESRGTWRWNDK